MNNKSKIITKINTDLADASDITASEHRSVLHTDPDSIVEAIYSDVNTESFGTISLFPETESTTITTGNANFAYRLEISKVGRIVSVSGLIAVANNQSSNSTVCTIDDTDMLASTDLLRNSTIGKSVLGSSDTIQIRIIGNELKIVDPVLTGELFIFSLTYNTVN